MDGNYSLKNLDLELERLYLRRLHEKARGLSTLRKELSNDHSISQVNGLKPDILFACVNRKFRCKDLLSIREEDFLSATYLAVMRRPIKEEERLRWSVFDIGGRANRIRILRKIKEQDDARRAKVRISGLWFWEGILIIYLLKNNLIKKVSNA